MKKQFLNLYLFLLFSIILLISCNKNLIDKKPNSQKTIAVPEKFAEEIARKFNSYKYLNTDSFNKNNNISTSALTGNNEIKNKFVINDSNGNPIIYIFNFMDNAGFIIVSADFEIRPILAYIDNGEYNGENLPKGFSDWLDRTKENFDVVRNDIYDNEIEGALAWRKYFEEYGVDTTLLEGKTMPINPNPNPCDNPPPPVNYVVMPLLKTSWGQSCTYNDLCDTNNNYNCNNFCGNGRPYTGCVATAIAQILRYHSFPINYNYSSMPLNSGNQAVQLLMSDVGKAVDMNYGCNGSFTSVGKIIPALKNKFQYTSANGWQFNSNYGRIETNIKNHMPVLLSGVDNSAGGHLWVCDGLNETTYFFGDCGSYNSSATYLNFHMNWGWHEANQYGTDFNGWYAFDNWNIYPINFNFQYHKYVISEIHP